MWEFTRGVKQFQYLFTYLSIFVQFDNVVEVPFTLYVSQVGIKGN